MIINKGANAVSKKLIYLFTSNKIVNLRGVGSVVIKYNTTTLELSLPQSLSVSSNIEYEIEFTGTELQVSY